MKRLLQQLFFIGAITSTAQLSFGQMVSVQLSNATAGDAHYVDKRNDPNYVINDSFAYDVDNPGNPYPNTDPSGADNYFLTKGDRDQNWWKCDITIPSGNSLKYLDLYARSGSHTNSGIYNRYSELKITLSDGLLEEIGYWTGIGATPQPADANTKNYGRWDMASAGFSESMLKNAISLRIDKSSDNVDTFVEIQEIRLAAETSTLSLNEASSNKLSIAPNPLESGDVTINLGHGSGNTIQIYSMLGALVYKQTIQPNRKVAISRSVFPSSGVYVVRVGKANSRLMIK